MTERTVMQCIPYKHVYSCPSSKISTIGYIALGVHETWHGEGRSEPLVFWIRQSLSKDGYKSIDVVLLNSNPVCLYQAALSWCLARENWEHQYLYCMYAYLHIICLCWKTLSLYASLYYTCHEFWNVIICVFESNISCLQDSKRVQIKKLPFNFAMAKINYSVQAVYLKNTCSHNKCIVVFFPM